MITSYSQVFSKNSSLFTLLSPFMMSSKVHVSEGWVCIVKFSVSMSLLKLLEMLDQGSD